MSRARAADDFATIRRRLDELRGERDAAAPASPEPGAEYLPAEAGAPRIDEGHRGRAEGAPPPWVPTIFCRHAGLTGVLDRKRRLVQAGRRGHLVDNGPRL